MWADYYEKYRGTPKFGMSEQEKISAQEKLAALHGAIQSQIWGGRLGTQRDIANLRAATSAKAQGYDYDADTGEFTPTAKGDLSAPQAAKTEQEATAADVNKKRADLLGETTDMTKKALAGGATDGGVNLTLSGLGPRGPQFTNLAATGQKDIMGEEAQAYKLQNNKVDAAIHAHTLLDAGFDDKTGNYDISKVPIAELGTAAANVITNDPGTDARTREEMRTKSLSGDTMGILSYITGKPMNAMTPGNAKMLSDIFERQGTLSEQLRDQHAQAVGATAKGNSFTKYLQGSKSYQYMNKQKLGGLTQATGQAVDPYADKKARLMQKYPDLAEA